MTTVRRRVLRPARSAATAAAANQIMIQKRQAQLDKERQTLARWMARLKRAFHAMERQQSRIVRIERNLAKLEQQ